MAEYRLLCIVLFTLIIGSQTRPQSDREEDTNNLSSGTNQKVRETGHMGDDNCTAYLANKAHHPISHSRTDFSAEGKGLHCKEDICKSAIDYPFEYIESIVKKFHGLRPNLKGEFVGSFVGSANRIKPGDSELNLLCDSRVETRFPKVIKNSRNITRYIINDGEFKQGVIYETCEGDLKCKKIASFPVNYEAECIQKYSIVLLMAIEENGDPVYDSFPVPSFCACGFKKTRDN